MGERASIALRAAPAAVLAMLVICSCVSMNWAPRGYAYFEPPSARDRWSPKIAGWQYRERAVQAEFVTPAVSGPGALAPTGRAAGPAAGNRTAPVDPKDSLRAKYEAFQRVQKRELARRVARWVQAEARRHYVPDGAVDHWATLEETLQRNGEDCDGLELLAYHSLRELGFRDDEVYRAIVYRPRDGQHHMVTFWFESPDDPWVIDPTGAMVNGMPRMSQVDGWVPLKVFSDDEEFTVRPRFEAPAPVATPARSARLARD